MSIDEDKESKLNNDEKMKDISGNINFDTKADESLVAGLQNFIESSASVMESFRKTSMILGKAFILAANKIHENLPKIVESIEKLSKTIIEIQRPLQAAQKLAHYQYIYFGFLDNELIDMILDSKNLNKTILEYLEDEDFASIYESIDYCSKHKRIKKYKRLFNQSISAFEQGYNELCLTGLVSIFDGVLADISDLNITPLEKRLDKIIKKAEKKGDIEDDDISLSLFSETFNKSMNLFIKCSDFNKKEPLYLNRHWIAHGRSTKKRTKLDCVKMINILRSILYLDDLTKEDGENIND